MGGLGVHGFGRVKLAVFFKTILIFLHFPSIAAVGTFKKFFRDSEYLTYESAVLFCFMLPFIINETLPIGWVPNLDYRAE